MGRPKKPFTLAPEKVKNLLDRAGMTQADLADALDVTSRTIQNWVNGINGVDETTVEDLGSILGVGVAEFAGRIPEAYRRRQTDAHSFCAERLSEASPELGELVCRAAERFLPTSTAFKLAGWPLRGCAAAVELRPSDNGECTARIRTVEPQSVRVWLRYDASILVEYAYIEMTDCGCRAFGSTFCTPNSDDDSTTRTFELDVTGPDGLDAIVVSSPRRIHVEKVRAN